MDQQGQNGLLATYREGWRNRNPIGLLISLSLVAFYLDLYFFDHLTPVAEALGLKNKWYLYGFSYCIAMIAGATYYLSKHGNSRYNQIRITVNVLIQIILGFTLPFVMPMFGGAEFYFSYFAPLKYDYLYPSTLADLPLYLSIYTLIGTFILTPIATLLYGKRWYCSWVCGCGGLANTFGDPYRHLTSKSKASWRFEQYSVHIVLGISILSTTLIAIDYFIGDTGSTFHNIVSGAKWDDLSIKRLYGLVVGSILAGVIGTGLYPVLGPRTWCRNFCPMAALLGLMQKFGRYRIAVKPDMCISCGNCSTYCEMGIDVRAYAQRNESFTRAACVGCGMCAHMCPRGVLKLENAPRKRLPIVE